MRGGYLGGQGGGSRRQKPRHGNVGGPMHDEMPMDHAPFIDSGDDAEIISPEELAASRKSMNLTTLKAKESQITLNIQMTFYKS